MVSMKDSLFSLNKEKHLNFENDEKRASSLIISLVSPLGQASSFRLDQRTKKKLFGPQIKRP